MKKYFSRCVFCFSFFLVLTACNDSDQIANPYPSLKTDLGEKSFAVLATDKTQNDRLLGILKFNQATQTTIEGSWRLETWGVNDPFTFPVNTGEKFPMVADMGSFSGKYFGTLLLINIELPEMGNSLAILIEEYDGKKLSGKISLLPELSFDGTFQAIEITENFNLKSF